MIVVAAKKLVYEDVPQPRPRDDEVLVRVYAAGVSPIDLSWPGTARIEPGTNQSMPIIPGHEMSGIVEEIGTRVIGVKTGDAV